MKGRLPGRPLCADYSEKKRVVSCEAGNYGELVLFDRSESVYFIDKLEVLTFPLGDTKDFPAGE